MGNDSRGSVPGARRFSRAPPNPALFVFEATRSCKAGVSCNRTTWVFADVDLVSFCVWNSEILFSQLSSADLWFSSFPGVISCFLRVSELEILRV